MKHIILTALALCAAATSFAEDRQVSGKTYTLTIPGEVEAKTSNDSDIYTFQWKQGIGTTIFVLGGSQMAFPPDKLKAQADTMQQELEKEFAKSFTVIEKSRKDAELGRFKGTEIGFKLKHKLGPTLQQYHYFLSDGTHTMHGQLIAHAEKDREQAHAITRSATRRGNKTGKPAK